MQQIKEVLSYWFGGSDKIDFEERSKIWFMGGDAVDAEIRERFEGLVKQAAVGELEHWKETPEGRVAWTILLDQFTRNMYRDTYRMYGFDALALQSAREAIAMGQDRELPIMHRCFLYLPLEHAECLEAQDQSVSSFKSLLPLAGDDLKTAIEKMVEFAERHAVVVRRFGRYPHRNELLNRASTPEELEFLDSDAAPF